MGSKWLTLQIIQSILLFKFLYVFTYYACGNKDLSFKLCCFYFTFILLPAFITLMFYFAYVPTKAFYSIHSWSTGRFLLNNVWQLWGSIQIVLKDLNIYIILSFLFKSGTSYKNMLPPLREYEWWKFGTSYQHSALN